jgi:pimeloyl-ACP methyl ester carboxylesterase
MIVGENPKGVAAASLGMTLRPDMTPLLGEIAVAALLVVGQHDAISTVDEMRSIAAAMPCARLVQISNAGHMSPMENPAEVNAAIEEFLDSLS